MTPREAVRANLEHARVWVRLLESRNDLPPRLLVQAREDEAAIAAVAEAVGA